jgi:hypothetical protein
MASHGKRGPLEHCAVCGRRRTLSQLRRLLRSLNYLTKWNAETSEFIGLHIPAGGLVCRHHDSVEEHEDRARRAHEVDALLEQHPQPAPFPREQYDVLVARHAVERAQFHAPAFEQSS